jgi:antitoxin (DNA-binding transcriptional repressor) of toxin-antitoxin stability system
VRQTVTTVGIRQLKNQLSEYLRRVSAGECVVVTKRGRPLAVIAQSTGSVEDRRVESLVREGLARWGVATPGELGGRFGCVGSPSHGRLLKADDKTLPRHQFRSRGGARGAYPPAHHS